MKIVVLDGYCLNPGDLSWDALRQLGEVVVHDRTPAGDVVARAHDATAVLLNKTPLTAEPPAAANPLLTARNCLVTPHIAWATREARARLMEEVIGNISGYFGGNPRNVIK